MFANRSFEMKKKKRKHYDLLFDKYTITERKGAVFLVHVCSMSILTSKPNSLLNNGLKYLNFQQKQAVNPAYCQSWISLSVSNNLQAALLSDKQQLYQSQKEKNSLLMLYIMTNTVVTRGKVKNSLSI